METRQNRLSEVDRLTMNKLIETLSRQDSLGRIEAFSKLRELISRVDAFDPLPKMDVVRPNVEVFQRVWPEAEQLRRTGTLLELGRQIRCQVAAIHGDYDPHPAEGVRHPLSKALTDFRMIVLEQCGHIPWMERQARDSFYAVLNDEIEVQG